YRLISQTSLGDVTQYEYAVDLVNSGSSASRVQATAQSSSPDLVTVQDTVVFGDVAANGTAPSLNTFLVQVTYPVTFSPSLLSGSIEASSAGTTVALLDDGNTPDPAASDGVYKGSIQAAVRRLRCDCSGNRSFGRESLLPNGKHEVSCFAT